MNVTKVLRCHWPALKDHYDYPIDTYLDSHVEDIDKTLEPLDAVVWGAVATGSTAIHNGVWFELDNA